MINELATSQNASLEIVNLKQEVEIYKLKNELHQIQAKKASRLEDSLFAPNLMPHYQKVAEVLAKSTIIPESYRGNPSNIFVAMSMGYQLGFSVEQSLQDIAVINGRPCLWGDGLIALVLNHPDCEKIKEEPIYDGNLIVGYSCTVYRKGHDPHTKTFTVQDAANAKLLGKIGPWTLYQPRMLQMRARVALRDKFPDALRGLRMVEEERDIEKSYVDDGKTIDAQPVSQVEKIKTMLNVPNGSNNSQLQNEEVTVQDIELIMTQRKFDEKKISDGMNYLKVNSINEMTPNQLLAFKRFLENISK